MTRYRVFLLAGCVGLGLGAGCASKQQYQAVGQVCATNIDKRQVMQIAEDVLAGMHFAIEKADLDSGLIRTRPLSGAQFFEFWRSDNVGPFNTALANLHSVQRTAEVHIRQQGDRLFIQCDVQIQKLSLTAREATRSPGAPVKVLRLTPEQEKGITWMDLGKDPELAGEILRRISSMLDARPASLDIEHRESSIE